MQTEIIESHSFRAWYIVRVLHDSSLNYPQVRNLFLLLILWVVLLIAIGAIFSNINRGSRLSLSSYCRPFRDSRHLRIPPLHFLNPTNCLKDWHSPEPPVKALHQNRHDEARDWLIVKHPHSHTTAYWILTLSGNPKYTLGDTAITSVSLVLCGQAFHVFPTVLASGSSM